MICYELWGNDTYSNEINLFGVYKHHSSAKRSKKNVNKIGQFNFPLSENFMDSQIKSIQFEVCPIKDSIDNVNLFLIIKFQNECNSKYVETGTLPEICSALESPDIVLMKSGLP